MTSSTRNGNGNASGPSFAFLAVLHGLNERDFRKKQAEYPEESRYLFLLATGIIGAENAKRIGETPGGIAEESGEFVSKLRDLGIPDGDKFLLILESCLVETLAGELAFVCQNCRNFTECLALEDSRVGELFRRRVMGDESDSVRDALEDEIGFLLSRTPYLDSDSALNCPRFRHQYSPAEAGEVLGRYASIAVSLRDEFGLDYRKIQQQFVSINMDFCTKGRDRFKV